MGNTDEATAIVGIRLDCVGSAFGRFAATGPVRSFSVRRVGPKTPRPAQILDS